MLHYRWFDWRTLAIVPIVWLFLGCNDGDIICTAGDFKCDETNISRVLKCRADGQKWEFFRECSFPERCSHGACDSSSNPVCGNGTCDAGENSTSCPVDCNNSSEICSNMIDDDGDGLIDCSDGDCVNDPMCTSQCGNGYCDPGESSSNCPQDCSTGPVCGNGILEFGEECDDGNTLAGDGCSPTCQAEQQCSPSVSVLGPSGGWGCGWYQQDALCFTPFSQLQYCFYNQWGLVGGSCLTFNADANGNYYHSYNMQPASDGSHCGTWIRLEVSDGVHQADNLFTPFCCN